MHCLLGKLKYDVFNCVLYNNLLFRYQTGIEKLNKANEQMHYMQEELVRLQPELVRTSLETT